MNQYLNNGTIRFYGYVLGFVVGLELAIHGLDLFSYLDTTVLSVSVRELFAEIGLLFSIFGGFLVALFKRNKKVVVLEYIQFLIMSVVAYLFVVCRFALVPNTVDSVALLLNGTLISEPSLFGSKVIIGLLGLLFLSVIYLDTVHNGFTALELPFLLGLILWTFLFSLYCFNLLVLFLLMEAITLLIVVSNTLYFVFTGPKLVKPVVQFFILNLMISTFYLLGVAIMVFMVPDQGAYTLSYATFWNAFEYWSTMTTDLALVILYFKLALGLILIPLVFKLTLAPFSIWVVNVYANLPIVFLLVIMTIYKIVYALLFLRLFVNVIDLVPELQGF
jgi:NADH:ubiquinone oxidoreductase subunit 2 (subunit N)